MKRLLTLLLGLIIGLGVAWAETTYEVSNPQQVTDLGNLSASDYYVLQLYSTGKYNYYDADNAQMDAKETLDYSCVVRLIYDGTNVQIQQVSTGTYYQGLTDQARLALGDDAVNYTFNTDPTNLNEGCFRLANGSCFLNKGSSDYPMGADQQWTGNNSQWKIYKVDVVVYDKVCTFVDGTNDPKGTLSTLSGNVLTSTTQTGIAGATLTAGVFDQAGWLDSRCLAIKPTAAQTAEQVVMTAPSGYYITGYEIEAFSVSPTYCPYLIDTNAEYSGTSLPGSKTTYKVHGLETESTYFWIYANAASVANWVGVSSFKVYLKQSPVLPEDGKVYNIDFVSLDQSKTWGLTTSGTAASVVANATGSEFVAHKYVNASGADRYIFVNNSDGYYLAYRAATATFDLNNAINEWSAAILSDYTGGNVSATDEQKAGKAYITNDKRYTNNAYKGCYILNESTAAFDNTENPYYNGTFTSALKFTVAGSSISDAAALAIKRFEALYSAKPHKTKIGTGLGTYSAVLNGTAYTDFDEYVSAVNSATAIDSYSIEANTPEDGKVYKISSYQNGGTLYQMVNAETVVNTTGTVVENNNGYWICRKDGDTYTFESAAGDGKFFGWQGLSTSGYGYNLLTDSQNSGCFSFYSATTTGGGRYLYVSNAGGWDRNGSPTCGTNGSTDFLLEEVDASVYTASITGCVDGQLTYGGADYVGSASVLNGGTWVLGNSVSASDFTAASVSGYSASEVSISGTTVSVKYSFNTSDIFSSDLATAKWLRVKSCLNSGLVMYATAESESLTTQARDLAASWQLLAFVGNADGFKIYSRAKGGDYALTATSVSNSSSTSWVSASEAAEWKLLDTDASAADSPGYGITLASDNSGQSLNLWNQVAGECRFYTLAGDKGSRWTYEVITQEKDIAITLDGETRYPETNYIWGTVNYTISGANPISASSAVSSASNTVLYLTDGYSVSSIGATAYYGYDVNVDGTTITFAGNDDEYQYLAYSPRAGKPYRIPAIEKAKNGNLVAIYDYRPCGNDVGFGDVDQVMRISKDNGRTWTAEQTIADGSAATTNVFGAAYGDPALVADRESNKMLLICVSGKQVYMYANATNRPFVASLTSEDGGETWSEPQDITSQFWGSADALFQNGDTESDASLFAYAGFFGSGKILQGTYKAPGASYNRLYAAMLVRGKNLQGAYVVYSDDFGQTWKLLGGDASVKPWGDSDEPKVEELPNGNILLSGRINGGRCFNIFTYTDAATGSGTWSTGGNLALGIANSTNGEVRIVNAVKADDDTPAKVLLLSVPKGPGRANVAVWYKDVTNAEDYDEVSDFTTAANWTLGYQVCEGSSCYSTFCVQQDGRIGLLFEKDPGSYCIVYLNTSIEELTGGAYKTPSSLEAVSDGAGTITLTGTATAASEVAAAISAAAADAVVTSVDLEGTWLQPGVADVQSAVSGVAGVSDNVLLYLPGLTEVPAGVNNVVVDGQCASLVLADKADFAPAAPFTAAQASYAKSGLDTEGWYSCVLPYAISVPEGVSIVNNASVDDNTITLSEVSGTVEANTPFLYKLSEGAAINFAATDAAVAPATTLESGELLGTYSLIPAGEATGKLLLNAAGTSFATATALASVPAFRAYLDAPSSGSGTYIIRIDDTPTGLLTVEGDGSASQAPVNVYGIDGRLLRSNVNPLTALQGLESGIYIINGIKVRK